MMYLVLLLLIRRVMVVKVPRRCTRHELSDIDHDQPERTTQNEEGIIGVNPNNAHISSYSAIPVHSSSYVDKHPCFITVCDKTQTFNVNSEKTTILKNDTVTEKSAIDILSHKSNGLESLGNTFVTKKYADLDQPLVQNLGKQTFKISNSEAHGKKNPEHVEDERSVDGKKTNCDQNRCFTEEKSNTTYEKSQRCESIIVNDRKYDNDVRYNTYSAESNYKVTQMTEETSNRDFTRTWPSNTSELDLQMKKKIEKAFIRFQGDMPNYGYGTFNHKEQLTTFLESYFKNQLKSKSKWSNNSFGLKKKQPSTCSKNHSSVNDDSKYASLKPLKPILKCSRRTRWPGVSRLLSKRSKRVQWQDEMRPTWSQNSSLVSDELPIPFYYLNWRELINTFVQFLDIRRYWNQA